MRIRSRSEQRMHLNVVTADLLHYIAYDIGRHYDLKAIRICSRLFLSRNYTQSHQAKTADDNYAPKSIPGAQATVFCRNAAQHIGGIGSFG